MSSFLVRSSSFENRHILTKIAGLDPAFEFGKVGLEIEETHELGPII